MKLVFFGTAELAGPSLRALCGAPEYAVLAVVTQPDRPKGRKMKPQPPPLKVVAQQCGKDVLQPERARDPAFLAQLTRLAPDLIVVAAYGQILPRQMLELPRFGCLNVHASILPKYRGAAPIQWALLNDDSETGVTLMKIDAGLDTGDVLAVQTTPITDTDNAPILHDRLAALGADLLLRSLPRYFSGALTPRPQPAEGASYARKIVREDGRLDWTLPARALWNRVRALIPWPGTYTFLPAEPMPRFLKVWAAVPEPESSGPPGVVLHVGPDGICVACSPGALRIVELQPENGRRMTARDFLAGHPLRVGTRLDDRAPPSSSNPATAPASGSDCPGPS